MEGYEVIVFVSVEVYEVIVSVPPCLQMLRMSVVVGCVLECGIIAL